jgi:two-component system, OmpR family, response regulator
MQASRAENSRRLFDARCDPPIAVVTAMRLLVVEDDAKLVRALQRGLEQEGYAVDVAQGGGEALAHADASEYDAIVLDLMLPGDDGVAVCEALRERERWVPVLMLTARTGVQDRIRGLDAGADDYLTKPFDFGELLARLRALIRRGPAEAAQAEIPAAEAPAAEIHIGDLRMDPETRIVSRDGTEVELTAREFAVLEYLARQPGRVVSRTELLDHVWDENYDGSPNIIDVYVGYLRKKLGRKLIRTVRGTGFMLEP